jgi:hypothetical protein
VLAPNNNAEPSAKTIPRSGTITGGVSASREAPGQ